MNTRKTSFVAGLLLCLVTALAAPQGAMAAGTPACTAIGNTASVAFDVGGFAQTPVSSNTNTITVGNKVDVIVTTTDASPGPAVVSNQNNALLHFTITNNGNANQRYLLSAVDLATGATTSVFVGNNTVTDVVLVSAGTATTGDATGGALVTTGTVTAGGTLSVTIKANMAGSLTDNTYDVFALRARTVKVDGTTLEADGSSTIDSTAGTCTADVVLGDGAGTDDAVAGASPDGSHSARSAYHVVLNNLSVSKSSIVWNDPINGDYPAAKAIPTATMEYTVVISNPGASSATTVTVTDALTGTLTPVTAAWSSTNGGSVSCTNQAVANIASAGWACLGTWAGQTLTATIPTLTTGQTATVLYRATIN